MRRLDQILAMLEDEDNDPFLRYALAMEQRKENLVADALKTFEHLASTHPDYVATYLQWAQLLMEEGQTEQARLAARTGLETARQAKDQHTAKELEEFIEELQ